MFVTHSVLEVLRGCRINVRGLVLLHCIKVVAEKYHQCPLFVRTYVQILSFKFTVEAIQFSCTSKILSERKRLVGSTEKYPQEPKIYNQSFNYTDEDFSGYTSISGEKDIYFWQLKIFWISVLPYITVYPRYA